MRSRGKSVGTMSNSSASSHEGNVFASRFGPKLCSYCNEFLSNVELNFDQLNGTGNVASEYYHNIHKSARSGCQLCIVIRHDIIDPETEVWNETMLSAAQNRGSSFAIFLKSITTAYSIRMYAKLHETISYPGTSRRQRVREELTSIQTYHDLSYTPPHSTDNETAWKLCDSWIENCINHHGRCNSFRPYPWYPTRLLYIGHLPNGYLTDEDLSSLNIQLHLTQDKPPKGGYMTLSHCWGIIAFEMLKLTSETYEDRLKNGFLYRELPKTFRDAVRLSRFLHNDYLWIDSLCIIQGSEDDWIHESKAMVDVYRHSKCNIAATAAEGPTEGCFYSRDPTIVSPLEIILRIGGVEENPITKRYLISSRRFWGRNVEEAPLNKRAWVFQERALSPRQIHCAKDQLLWECNQTTACETFPFIFEPYVDFDERRAPLAMNLTSLNLTLSEMSRLRFSETRHDPFPGSFISYPKESPFSIYSDVPRFERTLAHLERFNIDEKIELLRRDLFLDWMTIISEYSTLELTYKTDKLIAIFGIASRVQEALKDMDIYVAGLWRSQLPWMLLWWTRMSDVPPSYDCGPSWSWASFDRQVYFDAIPHPQDRVLINVDEAHDGHTAAKQGAVNSHRASYLKLRCLLYKIEPDIAANSGKHSVTRFITPINPRLGFRPRALHLDCIETVDYWHQAYIILVVDQRIKNMIWGLLVRLCKEEADCYRRIGVCWIDPDTEPNLTEHVREATDEDKVRITLI
ncbi:heterokaryon incompatibility protein-domain-containing protein [Daldinia vernicosa]|uniref:heterokaryon incompatibility protein-domain-containing protein n=1 Tax=Daldinia vernicosa TaxID=114800 RepID=UPI002008DF2E|nr:heterokaryon incompatibility protein-domain-containing protein [Daldinia vernicosa]KAI0845542.1 heterokaryon incompatibility protein-domain-containing protein [Daldinia vernicosa]